jgi:hypothetical protein
MRGKIAAGLFLVIFVFHSTAEAQRAHHSSSRAKSKPTPCPGVNDITDCPDEGCGDGDAELNKHKNIRSDNEAPTLRSIQWMKDLKNPPKSDCGSDSRDTLQQLGEGQKITVVAWALAARKGSQETCNCKLKLSQDTDNHIVLVDPALKQPTLDADEDDSETAEFTPRVRLDHPNFTQEKLEPLIDPDWSPGETPTTGKLLVRVTGVLMFDSEHYCRRPLTRHNNWEIHPVLKMEYCPEGETCQPDSDENWKDIESE